MRINNNLMAANSTRMLGVNQSGASKSMEKLSSGLRINKAGDDAAGLAISEKMRGQIRGLNQASKNAQDGISLLQTADGAMNQTHSILQRMRELAVQGSTDTLQDADRTQINEEFTALKGEIDDISSNTQYNKINLLKGSVADAGTGTLKAGLEGVTKIAVSSGAAAATYTLDAGTAGELTLTSSIGGEKQTLTGLGATTYTGDLNFDKLGVTISVNAADVDGTSALDTLTVIAAGTTTTDLTLQTGANENDELDVTINSMDTTSLGINTSDTTTAANARIAITDVDDAITTVSDERSKLGAVSNRLEYKMNSLDSSSENMQSAESKIRDVDMAKEMVNYSKTDILNQAAQAMLAKANQAPQNILQLLR